MELPKPDADTGAMHSQHRSTLISLLRLLAGTTILIGLCLLVSAPQALADLPRICRVLLFA